MECFTLVLKYMGDKSSKKSPELIIHHLLEKGHTTLEMRDELYCQVCKQTNNNPNTESCEKGWQLMILYAETFPPTKEFEGFLRSYISQLLKFPNEADKISKFVKYSLNKLDFICQSGARRNLPSKEEIEAVKEVPMMPTVFGTNLSEMMTLQKKQYPKLGVPLILTTLTDAIIKFEGCTVEGIFRVSGELDKIQKLKLQLELGNYEITALDSNPHNFAALLKLWLRELTEPLIPQNKYEECIMNCNDPKMCVEILEKLPKLNRRVLNYVIRFLQILTDPINQAKTKMTIDNISLVFAPSFLRCSSDDPNKIMEENRSGQTFVRNLILNLKL